MSFYDVTVIGGGPAGVCAALSAARTGAETLLVTDRPVLGGNSSSEVRVWTRGATGGGNLFAEEMGIWGELKLKGLKINPLGSVLAWDDVLLDAALREKRLTLLLNTRVVDVEMHKGHIQSITALGLRTEKSMTINSALFIDCTGDGFVAAKAGIPFRKGREDRAAFGESFALDKADEHSQGCSILLQSKRTGKAAPYTAPEYAYSMDRVRQLIDRGGRIVYSDMQGSDCWWFEYGGQLDIIADDQKIYLELRAIALGIWNYIKNSGRFDAGDLQLEWLGTYPGRRGSRRMIGEYTLTQKDITDSRSFDHAVAFGGWYLDRHPSGGVLSEKEQCKQYAVPVYGIPLGCLYSHQVDNLFFAGRCASMSYVAFSSARVMNTCAQMGQAAGTAAALCARDKQTPNELAASGLDTLLGRLALDDALISAQVHGLAADQVAASSQKRYDGAANDLRLPLTQDSFVVMPCAAGTETGFRVECEKEAFDLPYEAEVSALPSRRAPLSGHIEHGNFSLKKGMQTLSILPSQTGFCQVRLPAAAGVSLVGGPWQPGVLAGYQSEAELFYPSVVPCRDEQTSPSHVQDGYLRPWGGVHAWVSEGVAKDGEWLTLRWKSPVRLESVLVCFDPQLSGELTSSWCANWDMHHHYAAREAMPPTLVRDFDLLAETANGELTILSVRENDCRSSIYSFNPVLCTSLTLRVLTTYGGDAAVYALIPNPDDGRPKAASK